MIKNESEGGYKPEKNGVNTKSWLLGLLNLLLSYKDTKKVKKLIKAYWSKINKIGVELANDNIQNTVEIDYYEQELELIEVLEKKISTLLQTLPKGERLTFDTNNNLDSSYHLLNLLILVTTAKIESSTFNEIRLYVDKLVLILQRSEFLIEPQSQFCADDITITLFSNLIDKLYEKFDEYKNWFLYHEFAKAFLFNKNNFTINSFLSDSFNTKPELDKMLSNYIEISRPTIENVSDMILRIDLINRNGNESGLVKFYRTYGEEIYEFIGIEIRQLDQKRAPALFILLQSFFFICLKHGDYTKALGLMNFLDANFSVYNTYKFYRNCAILYLETQPHIYDKERCRKFLYKSLEGLNKTIIDIDQGKINLDKTAMYTEIGVILDVIKKLDEPDQDGGLGAKVIVPINTL